MKFENLMYDLETFSTMPDGVIISIGGCFFNYDGYVGPSFNLVLDLREQERLGRTYDSKTIQFWLRAEEQAKAIISISSKEKLSMQDAATRLQEQIETYTEGMYKYTAWSRGKDFDFPILKHWWIRTCRNKIEPWDFRNTRCCRDQQEYVSKEALKSFREKIDVECSHLVKHNSEHDAIRQALLVIKCEEWIRERIPA